MKYLIIFAVIVFVIPRLFRWLLRGFVASQMDKAQRDFMNQQQQYQQKQRHKREGQIDIDFVPPKQGKNADDFSGGEYIDYEEVK